MLIALGPVVVPDGTKIKWGVCRVGPEYVIPMYGYRTLEASLAGVWGLGVQLGLMALAAVRDREVTLPLEAVLILGEQCTDLRPTIDGFQCYLGLAFRMT